MHAQRWLSLRVRLQRFDLRSYIRSRTTDSRRRAQVHRTAIWGLRVADKPRPHLAIAWWRPSRPVLLLAAFLSVLAAVLAQDASFLSPDVIRVGGKLACRCGGCRNTVGDCPMLRCSSADPLRHRIYTLKANGMSDNAVVDAIVRQEGIVALAAPPGEGLGPIVTWVTPALVLLIGFFVYSAFIRRHRKAPEPLTATDESLIERFRDQIDREIEDDNPERDIDSPGSTGARR